MRGTRAGTKLQVTFSSAVHLLIISKLRLVELIPRGHLVSATREYSREEIYVYISSSVRVISSDRMILIRLVL